MGAIRSSLLYHLAFVAAKAPAVGRKQAEYSTWRFREGSKWTYKRPVAAILTTLTLLKAPCITSPRPASMDARAQRLHEADGSSCRRSLISRRLYGWFYLLSLSLVSLILPGPG